MTLPVRVGDLSGIFYIQMEHETHPHIDLLRRFWRGSTSPEEERRLAAWLDQADDGGDPDDAPIAEWEQAAEGYIPPIERERMLRELRRWMEEKTAPPPRRKGLSRWIPYAAAVAVAAGLGLNAWLYTRDSSPAPAPGLPYTVTAENGQRASVGLPDGTKVWLNSRSTLTYATSYGDSRREVNLSGEAYFEVAKDKTRPFVVKAGGLEVEALGTAFVVKAYEDDPAMTTTLYEGSIRATAGETSLTLKPDQRARLDRADGRLRMDTTSNPAYDLLWRSGEMAFERATLEEIATQLERMYNVDIRFLSDEVRHLRFSGVIRNNSLDNVIEIISLTSPITYRALGDTLYIGKK